MNKKTLLLLLIILILLPVATSCAFEFENDSIDEYNEGKSNFDNSPDKYDQDIWYNIKNDEKITAARKIEIPTEEFMISRELSGLSKKLSENIKEFKDDDTLRIIFSFTTNEFKNDYEKTINDINEKKSMAKSDITGTSYTASALNDKYTDELYTFLEKSFEERYNILIDSGLKDVEYSTPWLLGSFTATFTKKELLELAKDKRFYFYALGMNKRPANIPDNVGTELAYALSEIGNDEQLDIYFCPSGYKYDYTGYETESNKKTAGKMLSELGVLENNEYINMYQAEMVIIPGTYSVGYNENIAMLKGTFTKKEILDLIESGAEFIDIAREVNSSTYFS